MTKNKARKDAARQYQADNPGTTFPSALRAVSQPAGPQDIAVWWHLLTPESRDWLIEHNGEPLDPTIKAEIMMVSHGCTDPSWWHGESDEGESELTCDAIDWIEMVANDES